MSDKSGVEIYKRFYPWPERFRLGDPILVKEVTGMRWPEFVTALQEMEENPDEPPDQVAMAGMIAVAFWHGNQQMSRDKVRRAVEKIPVDDVEMIEGDDASPPEQTGEVDGTTPSLTSSESETSPASSSVTTLPSGSGSPGLHSVPPESLPA